MSNFIILILAEIVTVSFICFPAFFDKTLFLLMIVIMLLVTMTELHKVLSSARQRHLLFIMLIYPWPFILNLLLIYNLPNGSAFILFLFLIVELNDSVAYIIGKVFGKKRIFPKISPNKTYAGFFSGIFISYVVSMYVGHIIFQTSILNLTALVTITLIAGILGDLFTSYIKRKAEVKDFSTLIPTQGGLLDAYDGGTISIPGAYVGMLDNLPFGSAMNRSLTFKMGQTHVQHYMRPLLKLILEDKIDPSQIITHRLKLEDAPVAYKHFNNNKGECIKVIMTTY